MTTYQQRPHQKNLVATTIHPILARILASRGVEREDELNLELPQLLAPNLLKGIEGAAVFLADSLQAQKKLIIVADYDCDGATACAVGVKGLRMLGFECVDFLVPNRFTDGYGLTPGIVDQVLALPTKYDVLVTVDNGIASVTGVKYANEKGLAVLVTDHHLPGDETPEAAHIVNPNQRGCGFPSKNLAGVGVMFYVLIALRAELRKRGIYTAENQPAIHTLLDLVALGTVADVVQLDRNNRILINAGLKAIRTGRCCPGIAALFQVCGKSAADAVSTDLGFFIGPRINAAGRMDDMSIGINCLLSPKFEDAVALADRLHRFNRERRTVEQGIQEQASSLLLGVEIKDTYTIALADKDWHQGVIGIVAGRLKETYHRPTIIFADGETPDQPSFKGSGRSIPGFHLRDALDAVSKLHPEIIIKFGGHAMAAGLTIHKEKLQIFVEAFEAIAREMMSEELLSKKVFHDGSLETDDFNLELARSLATQVWGQGFPEPLFVGEFDVLESKILGEKHLKLKVKPKGSNPKSSALDAIWFNQTEVPHSGNLLAFKLSENKFRGESSLQLMVEGQAG